MYQVQKTICPVMLFAVPRVLHFQSVKEMQMGKPLPIVYLHLEPAVMIFAVPMILQFTPFTRFHGEMFAHKLLSYFEESEH